MDGRALAAVAFRVWGLILLLDSVVAIPGAILGFQATPWPPEQAQAIWATQYTFLVQLLLVAGVATVLVTWAEALARRAIPETPRLELGIGPEQLLEVGLVLLGVSFLVRGVEEAAVLAYVLPAEPLRGDTGALEYLWQSRTESLVSAIAYTLAGVVLVLGRAGFTRTWAEVRSFAKTGHGLARP